MAEMEQKLQQDDEAAGREVDITSLSRQDRTGAKPESRSGPRDTGRKLTRQVLGTCKRCGYMSSQELCKACVLLEGLNKNRPKMEIEIDVEEDDSSTLRRAMEGIALTAG